MTQMHAGYPIWKAGTEELAERYIPSLLDGSAYGSLASQEPDAGSDAAGLKTRAVPQGDDPAEPSAYRLSGSKTFITTGDRSDVLVCFATVDPAKRRRGITAFVVDGDAPGLTRGQPFAKMGMHGSTTAELFLEQVEVPAANRLGAEGDGWPIVLASVVKSRISAAAQGVVSPGRVREHAHRPARCLRGSATGRGDLRLAELRGEILQGRLLLLSIAREVDKDEAPSPGQIGIMKQSCTDLGWRASLKAARILGPLGDLASVGVERCIRDAKVTQIYDGTNEVQRLLIGPDTASRVKEAL